MKIQTKYFGDMEIEKQDVIVFQNGIPGFPDEQEFIFLPLEENSPYEIMQSIHTPEIALVTVSPYQFLKEYTIEINDQTTEQLEFTNPEDATVLVILSLKEPLEETTANLIAPVLINHKKRLAKQVVLENTNYKTKHLILQKESEEKEDQDAHIKKKAK